MNQEDIEKMESRITAINDGLLWAIEDIDDVLRTVTKIRKRIVQEREYLAAELARLSLKSSMQNIVDKMESALKINLKNTGYSYTSEPIDFRTEEDVINCIQVTYRVDADTYADTPKFKITLRISGNDSYCLVDIEKNYNGKVYNFASQKYILTDSEDIVEYCINQIGSAWGRL